MKRSGVISTGKAYPLLEVADMTPSQPEYRTIPLTRGQVTIVDAEDFEWLSKKRWYAASTRRSRGYYAASHESLRESGNTKMIRMHRMILGLSSDDCRQVDHIDRDSLNNRRSNLRVATPSENNSNRNLQSNNTSGFKGVTIHRQTGKWQAQITTNRMHRYLGLHATPAEAHMAYCAARATQQQKEAENGI